MTSRQFESRLVALGFQRYEHPLGYPPWSRVEVGIQQFVSRDNVRGGAFRLFLGRNCVPCVLPEPLPTGPEPLEAESPWFNYVESDEKPAALEACWPFLSTLGLQWLAAPERLSPSDWLFPHGISIRGAEIIRPRGRLP